MPRMVSSTGMGSFRFPAGPTGAGTLIPLSKIDSRFTSNSAGAGGPFSTGTIANSNWDENPGYTNGDACWAWQDFAGGNTVSFSKCMVDWREGPRLNGGVNTSSVINFDQCFINCVGQVTDHADGMQGFPGGLGSGTVNVTNTCFRCYDDAEALAVYGTGFIGSDNIFIADGWAGTFSFTNCLFWGGGNNFIIAADPPAQTGAVMNVSLNNCYFVGSPSNTPRISVINTGGTLNILAWNNVYFATIVNSSIIPGAAVPSP